MISASHLNHEARLRYWLGRQRERIGSDIYEAPMAYKDIHAVMAAQENLVEVLAKFEPRIVRMADAKERPED